MEPTKSLKVPLALHRRAKLAAAKAGESIQSLVIGAIERELKRRRG